MKKLFTLFFALGFVGALSAQTYYSEDFESGIPAGWTAENQWKHGTTGTLSSQYFTFPAHTQFMGTNDDALGSSGDASGRLITSDITLSAGNVPFLTFEYFFIDGDYQGADETAKVLLSTDAGTSWAEILDLGAGSGWTKAAYDMTSYIGQTFILAFAYDDGNGWNYGFGVDDIAIGELPAKDFKLLSANTACFRGPAGKTTEIFGYFLNNGAETITSLEVSWTDGANNYSETVTGLNVGAFEFGSFVLTQNHITLPSGQIDVDVSITNINDTGIDANTSDNAASLTAEGLVTNFHPDRGVLLEEGTGTWCGWCPRGTVTMDMLACFGDNFVGIAVHNGDPMVNTAYDDAINFSAYPTVKWERGAAESLNSPEDMLNIFIPKAEQSPPVIIRTGATFDAVTRQLTVKVFVQPQTDLTGDYKIAGILVEDGVTGSSAGYNQVNYYSGGANGQMNGYEILPGSVSASQMVYNHVGRHLLGGFSGAASSLPGTLTNGEWYEYTFPAYVVPAAWNVEEMDIAALVLGPNGQAVNAWKTSVEDAEIFTGVNDAVVLNQEVEVFPNPFNETTNIRLNLETVSEVSLRVFNAMGQQVAARNYGQLSGETILPVNGANLEAGMYFFHIEINGAVVTKRVNLTK